MDADEIYALTAAERRRAADVIATLDSAQLDSRSLCGSWTVRDIAGHLVAPFALSVPSFLIGVIRYGGFHRFNQRAAVDLASRPVADNVAMLRANAETEFALPGVGPSGQLADLCIHTRDVAVPLGIDVTAAPMAWRGAVEFLVTSKASRGFVPRARLAGLSFSATDSDWTFAGTGGVVSEVRGTMAAIAMSLAGRSCDLDALDGAGGAVLRERVGGES